MLEAIISAGVTLLVHDLAVINIGLYQEHRRCKDN